MELIAAAIVIVLLGFWSLGLARDLRQARDEAESLRRVNDTLRRRIAPLDHDGDGRPGGSLKRTKA